MQEWDLRAARYCKIEGWWLGVEQFRGGLSNFFNLAMSANRMLQGKICYIFVMMEGGECEYMGGKESTEILEAKNEPQQTIAVVYRESHK